MSTLDDGWNDDAPRCWCGGYLRDHWRGRECLRPLGGAHPDAWRQAEQPEDERLYVADGVAIMARDPEEAARLAVEASMARMQRLFEAWVMASFADPHFTDWATISRLDEQIQRELRMEEKLL